jgi:hypothetical protein
VRDDSATHLCPERHEDQVINVFAHAEAELTPSRRVGVVLDSDRQPRAAAQLFLEGYAFDRLEVGGTQDLVFAGLYEARDGKADAAYLVSSLDIRDRLGDGRE